MASSPVFRLRTAVLLFVLAGAGVATYFLMWNKPQPAPLPPPGSALYEEYAEAFQVGVAALDAGLHDLAQKKLTEAIEKIPEEPAAWANRGLLHLRHNEQREAAADLQRAHELAPDSSEIESLLGLLADRQGKLSDAAAHYRKALVRDPQDIVTRYALAEILSREGGPESDTEYQEQLAEILRVQPNNLFVLTEYAGAAARRSDAAALRDALQRLRQLDGFWSPDNRKRLQSVEKAAAGALPGDLPLALIEFKNCLVTELGFARSSAAVGSKSGGSGNAVEHFLRLARLRPTPAAPDTALAFSPEPFKAIPGGDATRWNTVQAVWLTEGPEPAVFVASGRELRRVDAAAPALPFPGGPKVVPPTVAGVLGVDWNNDYRTDLLLAGAGGLRFFQQSADGKFTDVTARTGLDQTTLQADYYGVWDIIAAPRHGPPLVLRNNRDGTFKALQPFAGVEAVRAFVWADFDNDGAPDAAFLDAEGKIHVFANERSGQFRKREVPSDHGKALALAVADVTDDGVFDLLALRAGGGIMRLSDREKGKSWDVAEVVGGPTLSTSLEPGDAVLLIADLDNNGSLDLIASTADGTQVWLGDAAGRFQPLPSAPAARVAAAVDLSGTAGLTCSPCPTPASRFAS